MANFDYLLRMSIIEILDLIIKILSIIGGFTGIIAFIIILYDHYKDDRLLNKRVRYFYNTIEKLIFSYYVKAIIQKEHRNLKDLEKNTLELMNKHEIDNIGYQVIIRRLLDDNAHYIGLFYDSVLHRFHVDFYIDGIKYLLEDAGCLFKFSRNPNNTLNETFAFIKSGESKIIMTKKEVQIINRFLEKLRHYWKENYSEKRIFRRPIREKNLTDFNKLLEINNY